MRKLWETTEQILIVMGIGIVGLQISMFFNFVFLSILFFVMMLLVSSMLMLQFYMQKDS